tara:strand:- start:94 stop:360 length:267 start_codon:yes stop_codon:yes gene_type:complete
MPLTYTRIFTDAELNALHNDLTSPADWVDQAIIGKISNCSKRMEREWIPKLQADPDVSSIPADRDALIALVLSRSDYQNRAARDAAGE